MYREPKGDYFLRFVALRLVVFFAAFFTAFLAVFLTAFFTVFFAARFLGAAFFTVFLAVFLFFAAIGIAMTMTNSVDPSPRRFLENFLADVLLIIITCVYIYFLQRKNKCG